MKIRKLIVGYLSSSWIPVVTAMILMLSTVAAGYAGLSRLDAALFWVFIASLLGIVAAAVMSFVRRRWKRGLLHLLSLVAVIAACVLITAGLIFGSLLESSDHFADHLTIPKGITVSQPLRAHDHADGVARPMMSPPTHPTLRLWNSFQPGIYKSEIWANPGEKGMAYLRAYEVTHNTELSKDILRERSIRRIGWSSDPGKLFPSKAEFTIYEGDWGKPYAARFEVWFAPDSGRPKRKLLQRVFRIEGWQR